MEVQVVFIQVISFLAVVLFVTGLKAVLSGESGPAPGAKPLIFRSFAGEITTVGAFVNPIADQMNPGKTILIRNDLIAAALAVEVFEVRGLQGLAMLLGSVCGGLLVFLMSMNVLYAILGFIGFGFIGWIYPVIWVAGSARRRKDAMSRALPYAIDLVTVAMQAGQDFGAAVRHLVNDGPRGPLCQEFAIALRQTELGKSRVEALKAMADRIQLDEFRSLVTSVIQSTEMGASIAQTMKIQAEEIRRARYHKAERQAARAPSLMLIPVALFILPAVFIVIFTPVGIRMMESGIGGFMGK